MTCGAWEKRVILRMKPIVLNLKRRYNLHEFLPGSALSNPALFLGFHSFLLYESLLCRRVLLSPVLRSLSLQTDDVVRVSVDWVPERLLCKRFDVQYPWTERYVVAVVALSRCFLVFLHFSRLWYPFAFKTITSLIPTNSPSRTPLHITHGLYCNRIPDLRADVAAEQRKREGRVVVPATISPTAQAIKFTPTTMTQKPSPLSTTVEVIATCCKGM